ncbi:subtilisin-like protease SBT1.8 [Dendrobium catenatum]|uniref:Subtilisin-like protease n=1 Tax=Dendrobium catenatum TaxID=906689 RepID=A0A2I0WG99_9ASPA|nr:subtilisin-like protease SBT1.8 [Dendrobium catenatum]PKU74694.1 Subtilisin-like protease [Dendrobium catenatum]
MAAASKRSRSAGMPLVLISIVFFLWFTHLVSGNKTYIVYMNPDYKPSVHPTYAHWYSSHLASLSIDPARHLIYSYSNALHAFAAASLLPRHLRILRRSPAVLHLHPDPLIRLHTTRTPFFLGLSPSSPSSPFRSADAASGSVIIGVLDTGVWPESPSFDDASLPPIPSRWRGHCEAGVDFAPSLCNRKLIGARAFSRGFLAGSGAPGKPPQEYDSPRDRDGHGTHTASTAAGGPAANASLLGYASGTARGMCTACRIAAYKVCWASGCFGSDILAGIDRAISDGVDVLSLSLGGGTAPFFRDTIAVGAFAAAERGIFVACSAGNSGPGWGSITNSAPWIATVGAGTIDRDFPAYVTLDSGDRFAGVSLYSGEGMEETLVPLFYDNRNNASRMCLSGTLDPANIKGRVVLCDRGVSARVEKGAVIRDSGGVGMILANTAANGEELVADSHLLPAVAVGKIAGDKIRKYIISHQKPKAVLRFGGTVVGVRPSPVVAAFSSRGPNPVTPEILKPDLIGPGVNILAGWSGSVGPTGMPKDARRTQFNIMSGTSMSCPHISGLAALLKAAHQDWSPAAIKSALMTTAYSRDNTGNHVRDAAGGLAATSLAYGAGHVDPQKALEPGLVYDITTDDYIAFLCSLNYTLPHIQAIAKRSNFSCSRRLKSPGDLNYPSFSVIFSGNTKVVRYGRELTNVGAAGLVYEVSVGGPATVGVSVKPSRLFFKQVGQKLKYSVTFVSMRGASAKPPPPRTGTTAFGWLTWSNKQHKVRSPIAYTWRM